MSPYPAMPAEMLAERHMRGVIWQDGRPFATIMPPCAAGHRCCEFIGDDCLLCARDRWWASIGFTPTRPAPEDRT